MGTSHIVEGKCYFLQVGDELLNTLQPSNLKESQDSCQHRMPCGAWRTTDGQGRD